MRKQILILLLLRLRLRRRRLDYYYYYDYYLRLLVLPTTTTTTAITMHWLLASLLVLPPPTGPLALVGLKRDARRTELVFQVHGRRLVHYGARCHTVTLLRARRRGSGWARIVTSFFSPHGQRNPFPDVPFVRDKGALELP